MSEPLGDVAGVWNEVPESTWGVVGPGREEMQPFRPKAATASIGVEQSMFVQTAQGMTSDGKTLTLEGVMPSTLYFSDRPQRVVGHMATGDFVELWGEGDDSFQDDPPNAVLAFLEPGDDVPEDAVVVIEAPRVENGKLSYAIQTLEGTVPAQAGPVTLFIDPFGRPLSPVSVCGVRRRERRRARRPF
ncbi:MAG: hypothetical protein WAL38_03000 [Solirubrobacteraceae bacterium]